VQSKIKANAVFLEISHKKIADSTQHTQ